LVARQLARELVELGRDQAAKREDQDNAKRTTLRTASVRGIRARCRNPHEGSQHKAEQDRERNWDEDFAAEVQRPIRIVITTAAAAPVMS
jgi:hypothetical protein